MDRSSSGFTLLEVLIAVIVVTVGLLGLAGSLGPITALAGQGRLQGRAALALASRADLLRSEIQAGSPACPVPASGSRRHPDGFLESWRSTPRTGSIELEITAGRDTLVTRVPCP